MLRKVTLVVCVLGVLTVALWAGVVQAGFLAYSANDDMYASENGSSPSPAFGTWSTGYRSALASTGLTAYSTHVGAGGIYTSGWAVDAGEIPSVQVNRQTSGIQPPGWDVVLPSKGLHVFPGEDGTYEYTVLRWTAPTAGTVNVAGNLLRLDTDGSGIVDAHVVLNGTSKFDTYINTNPTINVTGIAVAAGDVLDLAIGNGDNNNLSGENTGVVGYSITYVPEPSAMILLGCGLTSLLAYAWRKRR